MQFVVVGIDPRIGGGIVAFGLDSGWYIDKVSEDDFALWDEMRKLKVLAIAEGKSLRVFVERVGPVVGGLYESAESFRLGFGYGRVRAILSGLRVSFEAVSVVDCRRKMGDLFGQEGGWRERVRELYVEAPIEDWNLSAFVMCEYGRRYLQEERGEEYVEDDLGADVIVGEDLG